VTVEKSIYEQLYEFENQQRVHLASTVNVPIIAATALGSALVAMVLGYPFAWAPLTLLFVASLIVAALALGGSVAFVFLALIGYKYQKIPGPRALQAHERELRAYQLKEQGVGSESEAEKVVSETFRTSLEDAFVRATEVNAANNRNRGNSVYRANLCSAIATVALALGGAVYVIAKIGKPADVHSIRIVGEVTMSEKTVPPADPKPHETIPNPERSGPPAFPPNEEYRDYTIDRPVPVEVPLHEVERR
jgi:hypothetical protein